MCSCTDTSEEISRQNLTSVTSKGTSGIEVKPLDDDSNPYAGHYEEWDEWIYSNARSKPIAWQRGEVPETWGVLVGYVNADGYLVPQREFTRLRQEAFKDGTIEGFHEDFFQVYGEGEVPAGLSDEYSDCMDAVIASYFPTIPGWLVASPPHSAMLLPDGNIATHGKMTDSQEEEHPEPCCGAYDYYLYAPDGEELKTVRKESTWWMLYFDVDVQGWPEGEFCNRRDGYFYFTNPLTGQVLSIWDYTGDRLPTTVQPPARDSHNFIWIRREQLLSYFNHQNS